MKETTDSKRLKELYLPPQNEFVLVDVPQMQFVMIDGEGRPGSEAYMHSMQWLFAAVYPIKGIAKERMGKNFVEPPLEALYWADDMEAFKARDKDQWKWRIMIVAPAWLEEETFEKAVAKTAKRLGEVPCSLRLDKYHEGKSVQIMHVGPFKEEQPIVTRLYGEFLPQNSLEPNGHYHEIYLTDPSRVAPEKMKTVLRQPVR